MSSNVAKVAQARLAPHEHSNLLALYDAGAHRDGAALPLPIKTRLSVEEATIDEFLEWFPGVSREQIDEVLMFTSQSLAIA